MDELKLLIDMVANLPQMALWVLCGFLAYKLAVIGSIYGVIHFTVDKLHDYLIKRRTEYKEVRALVDGMCINAAIEPLMAQLHRLKGRRTGISSTYIHKNSVDWLREAIDEKEIRDTFVAEQK